MIHAKDHKQGYLLDPWDYLGPKRRKLMEESWAGFFREEILNNLPVGELARHFEDGIGRPTKELFTALGVQILQHMNDLTDEETVEQLAFRSGYSRRIRQSKVHESQDPLEHAQTDRCKRY